MRHLGNNVYVWDYYGLRAELYKQVSVNGYVSLAVVQLRKINGRVAIKYIDGATTHVEMIIEKLRGESALADVGDLQQYWHEKPPTASQTNIQPFQTGQANCR